MKRRRRRRRRNHRGRVILTVFIVFVSVILGFTAAGLLLLNTGKKELMAKSAEVRPVLESFVTEAGEEVETEVVDENTVKYQGESYRYNEDVISILFMGIDSTGELEGHATVDETATETQPEESSGMTGERAEQVDVLFLVVMNNKAKEVNVIQINRDTMTDISIYGTDGQYLGKAKEQLALSYAYGDGGAKSAALTVEAVSNLFYGLPINGYCILNMSAIPLLGEMIGGVELTMLEDFSQYGAQYAKGNTAVIEGAMIEKYIRDRKNVADGSNENRMARQKQYIQALALKALQKVKNDLTLPVSMYSTLSKYMITDISVSEVSYLASEIVNYSVPDGYMRTLQGTAEDKYPYVEFVIDEKSLYELILDVFYEKADTYNGFSSQNTTK